MSFGGFRIGSKKQNLRLTIVSTIASIAPLSAFAKQRFQQMPEIPAGLDTSRQVRSQDQAETFVIIVPTDPPPLGTLHEWKVCAKRNKTQEQIGLGSGCPELTGDKEKPTAVCAKKEHKGTAGAVIQGNSREPLVSKTLLAKVNFLMPQHQHGINTVPKVSTHVLKTEDPLYKDFAYCVHAAGVRFHMAGWWQLQLEVNASQTSAESTDQATSRFATFNWILQ